MVLKNQVEMLGEYAQKNAKLLDHNNILFNIYEGDLESYVLADMKKQLSPDSFDQAQYRVAPINILRRLVEKLSRIYGNNVARWLEDENEADQSLFEWYLDTIKPNTQMQISNEFFNLFKNCAIEPFVKERKPALRVLPSDRFLMFSENQVDPTQPTHFLKFMGKRKRNGNVESVIYIYTDTEFLPVNEKNQVLEDILIQLNNPNGQNPYGKIPAVYLNRSRHSLLPQPDTDTLRMTKLFPLMLSDLNWAASMQSYSIIYGVDLDEQNLTMAPNAFWRLKSDPSSKNTPQIGTIKPQVDIAQVTAYIGAQLSMWLQSRNIRPGQVGQIGTEGFASAISKIVDDMDTYEDRQKQVPYFVDAEAELWNLIMHAMHPVWVREGAIDEQRTFTPGQRVITEFPPQTPMPRRSETLDDLKKETELGAITKKDIIIRLNPGMDETQAAEYLKIIEAERTVAISETVETETEAASHYHELPMGGRTGLAESASDGHKHLAWVAQGSNVYTSTDKDEPGHTHSLPAGDETGKAIETEKEAD